VQQHLGRLDGVDKVDVNLEGGRVTILAKEDSALDPARVFKATYDSGVSVAEMTMDAAGRLERDAKNVLIFRISGSQLYPIVENETVKPFAANLPPDKVFVRAMLFKQTGKQKPKALGAVRLEVLEITKQP
jgi:hypothetical protein